MRATVAHATTKAGEKVRGIAILMRRAEGDLAGYERITTFIDHTGRVIGGDDLATRECLAECGCFEYEFGNG